MKRQRSPLKMCTQTAQVTPAPLVLESCSPQDLIKSVLENSEVKEHWVWAGEVAQQAEALVTKPDKLPYPGSTK